MIKENTVCTWAHMELSKYFLDLEGPQKIGKVLADRGPLQREKLYTENKNIRLISYS